MSRSRAGEIITEKLGFPQDVTLAVNLGKLSVPQTSLEAYVSDKGTDPASKLGVMLGGSPINGRWYKRVADEGLATLDWVGTMNVGGILPTTQGIITFELTNEGLVYAVGKERKTKQGNLQVRSITLKLCERQFDSVTGIKMIQGPFGNGAQVEYQWKYGDKTPFGTAQAQLYPQNAMCPDRLQAASAFMQLYDDGWRLAK